MFTTKLSNLYDGYGKSSIVVISLRCLLCKMQKLSLSRDVYEYMLNSTVRIGAILTIPILFMLKTSFGSYKFGDSYTLYSVLKPI